MQLFPQKVRHQILSVSCSHRKKVNIELESLSNFEMLQFSCEISGFGCILVYASQSGKCQKEGDEKHRDMIICICQWGLMWRLKIDKWKRLDISLQRMDIKTTLAPQLIGNVKEKGNDNDNEKDKDKDISVYSGWTSKPLWLWPPCWLAMSKKRTMTMTMTKTKTYQFAVDRHRNHFGPLLIGYSARECHPSTHLLQTTRIYLFKSG